jgi:hypothetical protein
LFAKLIAAKNKKGKQVGNFSFFRISPAFDPILKKI